MTRVFRREQVFRLAGNGDIAPDMVIGYASGTRTSDESALGSVPPQALVDNRSPWNGDHCMDPAFVPGILLTSRPLHRPATHLGDLAAAILAEAGIEGFPSTRKEY